MYVEDFVRRATQYKRIYWTPQWPLCMYVRLMPTNKYMRKKTALFVIDMQKYFCKRGAAAYLKDAPKIIPNVLKLISAFREKGLLIVFTRHAHKKGLSTGQMGKWWNEKLPWAGTPESELIDEIKPKKDEILLTKTRYSAFEKTGLDKKLKKMGVETVVICGVMTNLCVETTARHAFMKNFEPVIIEDASAANTKRHHLASILNLSYGFAEIKKTKDLCKFSTQ